MLKVSHDPERGGYSIYMLRRNKWERFQSSYPTHEAGRKALLEWEAKWRPLGEAGAAVKEPLA